MSASQSLSPSLNLNVNEPPPSLITPLIGFVVTTALTSTVMMLLSQL